MAEMDEGCWDDEVRYLVVFVTTKDREEAMSIAEVLVSERLAACANVLEPVVSVYTWKGKLERSAEALMIIKTHADVFPLLVERVKELHSYDVPEIIGIPITGGNPAYLKWIDEATTDHLLD
jgi:periplasmic divalent cation tolerance protein